MLFPTFRKSKISSKLSYPVGAELISSELATVPQAQSFDIWFRDKHERLKTRGKPYDILEVSYGGPRGYRPGWHIVVEPVPRALKHTIRTALKSEFFPRIRTWLQELGTPNTTYGGAGIRVVFDEKSEIILRLEGHPPPPVLSLRPRMYNKSDRSTIFRPPVDPLMLKGRTRDSYRRSESELLP